MHHTLLNTPGFFPFVDDSHFCTLFFLFRNSFAECVLHPGSRTKHSKRSSKYLGKCSQPVQDARMHFGKEGARIASLGGRRRRRRAAEVFSLWMVFEIKQV